jgi:four helix bundle protein
MRDKNYSFENLIVWQKSHQFVLDIYSIAKNFPKDETYGLTSQLKRASVSIPANIAEGFGRRGDKDKLRFYNISRASLLEVKYFLILVHDLNYCDTLILRNNLNEIEKMLYVYTTKIKQN